MARTFGKVSAPSWKTGKQVLRTSAQGLREGVSIEFGIPDVDARVPRLRQGDLVLMAGPPHGFKTQVCIALVEANPDVNFLWASPDEGQEFVLRKMIRARYGLTEEEFDDVMLDDESYFDDDVEEIENHVAITDESDPHKLLALAQEIEAEFGELHCLIFDYVETLDLGRDIPPKLAWLQRFGRKNNVLVVAIHQSTKVGLDLSIIPTLAMLSEAGHKEAFLVLWSKRPYVDSEDLLATRQDENQASTELWLIKNKRGRTYHRPVKLAIEDGNRVTQWTATHDKRAKGLVK